MTTKEQEKDQTTKVNVINIDEAIASGKFAGVDGKCAICGKPTWKGQGIGDTCKGHLGKVGAFYKPAPANVRDNPDFIPLTKLCDLAEERGKSRGFAVSLTGGDAGTKSPQSPAFQIYVLGKRKFVKVEARAALEKILSKK